MDGSVLSDLSSPGLVTVYSMWDALLSIDQLLRRDGLPDAAKVSGVAHILADRLPPLSSPLDWPHSPLNPGATPAEAAGYIYGILGWNPGPATSVFARLAKADIAIETIGTADLNLAATEADDLRAAPGDPAWERGGEITAGTVWGTLVIARTRLLLLPRRIPAELWEKVTAGELAGEVLEVAGMRRIRRHVFVSPRDGQSVDASATLVLGDWPVGTVEEHITDDFCRYVAELAR